MNWYSQTQATTGLSLAGVRRRHRRNGLPALVPRPAGHAIVENHGAGTPDSDADTDLAFELHRHVVARASDPSDRYRGGHHFHGPHQAASPLPVRLRDLHLPVTGEILQKIILARFANFFALMYRSGITILEAVKTSEDIVANRGDRRRPAACGGSRSMPAKACPEAFQNLGMFPPLVIRMLRVGESTGALDTALMNVTYFYNRDVRDSVDKAFETS